jgi:hypothetical protein
VEYDRGAATRGTLQEGARFANWCDGDAKLRQMFVDNGQPGNYNALL